MFQNFKNKNNLKTNKIYMILIANIHKLQIIFIIYKLNKVLSIIIYFIFLYMQTMIESVKVII
jgi:hypothetical protein